MKIKSCLIRMNLSTLKKLREMIPPLDNESASNYFERVATILEDTLNTIEKGARYYD